MVAIKINLFYIFNSHLELIFNDLRSCNNPTEFFLLAKKFLVDNFLGVSQCVVHFSGNCPRVKSN